MPHPARKIRPIFSIAVPLTPNPLNAAHKSVDENFRYDGANETVELLDKYDPTSITRATNATNSPIATNVGLDG